MSFAITLDDKLYAWGDNKYGQLGLGDYDQILIPQKVLVPNVKKIICKYPLTMAITLTNDVYYWGYNDKFPIKLELSNVKDISHGYNHNITLTYDNQIYGWGSNGSSQLGLKECRRYRTPTLIELSNVREVICAFHHSFAITYTNELYAWGQNSKEQLGVGENKEVLIPCKVAIENVKQVYCPFDYLTIIITWSDEVYYCGIWQGYKSNIPERLHF